VKTLTPQRIIEAPLSGPARTAGGRSNLRTVRRVAAFLPAVLLIFAVLTFGATVEWAQFVFQAGAATLLLVWGCIQFLSEDISVRPSPLYAPFATVISIALIQLGFHTSAYAYATKLELLQILAYAAVFFAACNFWQEATDRGRILKLLTIFGFLVALFAIIQGLASNGNIYWLVTPRFGGAVYGPYVNRNHYAGLMEMLAPVPFALATVRGKNLEQRLLLMFSGTLMGISIFTSQSRAGMASFALEMLLFSVVLLRVRRSIRTGAAITFGAAIFAAFIVWFGGTELFRRFSEMSDAVRAPIVRDAIVMFIHRPLMGWGLGTFPTIYPHFRSFYTNLFVNEAHNDFAQFAVETGLLGIAVGAWFVFSLYRKALRSLENWSASVSDAAVLAGITGCSGLLFHSLFDFNLHIPANATAFFLFCALATLGRSDHRHSSGVGEPPPAAIKPNSAQASDNSSL
jgi:O-antigen ligase